MFSLADFSDQSDFHILSLFFDEIVLKRLRKWKRKEI